MNDQTNPFILSTHFKMTVWLGSPMIKHRLLRGLRVFEFYALQCRIFPFACRSRTPASVIKQYNFDTSGGAVVL